MQLLVKLFPSYVVLGNFVRRVIFWAKFPQLSEETNQEQQSRRENRLVVVVGARNSIF